MSSTETPPATSASTKLPSALKRLVGRVLPGKAVAQLQLYRSFSKPERAAYLRLRARLAFGGLQKPDFSILPGSGPIVFLCFGNIMRSPMCEALMKRELEKRSGDDIAVTSAGLNATPGKAAHPWAVEAAKALDVDLEKHRARVVTEGMVREAKAIFLMDFLNYAQLVSRFPFSRKKAFFLCSYSHRERCVEIRDPYQFGLEETRRCYAILAECIHNFSEDLLPSANQTQQPLTEG